MVKKDYVIQKRMNSTGCNGRDPNFLTPTSTFLFAGGSKIKKIDVRD